jgi:predicted Zn-dependent protease
MDHGNPRKLNLPVLIGLVVTAAALVLGVRYIHGLQSRRMTSALLRQAEQADAIGERDRSLYYLEHYLAYKPDDHEAQIRFGLSYADTVQGPGGKLNAFFLLERALRHSPEREEIRRKVAKLALELSARDPGRLSDAGEHLGVLLKAHPNDPDLAQDLGRFHDLSRRFADAAEWYRKAIGRDAGRIFCYMRLAELLRTRLEQPERADRIMAELVGANPKSPAAWVARAEYRERFDLSGIDDDLAQARSLAPDEASVLLASGERAKRRGDSAAARRALERGVELFPKNLEFRLALGALEADSGRLEAAERCLERGIENLPDRNELRLALIEVRIRRGELSKARTELDALRGRGPARAWLDLLDGEILMKQERWQDAVAVLQPLDHALAGNPRMAMAVNVTLGECYRHLGRADRQFEALAHAAELAGNSPRTWLGLVRQLARADQLNKAEDIIQRAGRVLTGTAAPLTLARCYAAIGRNDRAAQYYRVAVDAHPDDISTLKEVAQYALTLEQRQPAMVMLGRIMALKSKTAEDVEWSRQMFVKILAECGDYRAISRMNVLRGKAGEALAGAGQESSKTELVSWGRERRLAAIQRLAPLLASPSPSPDLRFVLACLYESNRDWAKARVQLERLQSECPDDPFYLEHFTRALLGHAEIDEAARRLAQLRELEPWSIRTVSLMARVLKAQGNGEEARNVLKHYASRDGSEALRFARLLEELGEDDAAEQLLRSSPSDASGRPQGELDLARFLGRHGRTGEALDICELQTRNHTVEEIASTSIQVIDVANPDPAHVTRVERWLIDALARNRGSIALNFTLASLRKLQGRSEEAAALYRKLVDSAEPTGLALNNLAYLLAANEGRFTEAAELIGRAIAAHGPLPGLLDTRAFVNIKAGQVAAAIEDLEDASARVATGLRLFRLAEAYHLAKDDRAALEAFQEAKRLGLSDKSVPPRDRESYRQLAEILAQR